MKENKENSVEKKYMVQLSSRVVVPRLNTCQTQLLGLLQQVVGTPRVSDMGGLL